VVGASGSCVIGLVSSSFAPLDAEASTKHLLNIRQIVSGTGPIFSSEEFEDDIFARVIAKRWVLGFDAGD